jgi:hypothetical protein
MLARRVEIGFVDFLQPGWGKSSSSCEAHVDCRLTIADCRLRLVHRRLTIADLSRLSIADCRQPPTASRHQPAAISQPPEVARGD